LVIWHLPFVIEREAQQSSRSDESLRQASIDNHRGAVRESSQG